MTMRPQAPRLGFRPGQRCLDCEHYDEDGCEQAAEALLQDGWPRATVQVDDDAGACRCPEFSPNADYALAQDEEDSARRLQLRQAALTQIARW